VFACVSSEVSSEHLYNKTIQLGILDSDSLVKLTIVEINVAPTRLLPCCVGGSRSNASSSIAVSSYIRDLF
jgi:hypothetical protein